MSENLPEFSEGDTVTFQPYELAVPVKVIEVLPDHFGDGRVAYHLQADPQFGPFGRKTPSAKSYTTGSCIAESKLFVPFIPNE